MLSTNVFRRASIFTSLALASVLATGCLDSAGPDEHEEPEIAGIAISAATGSVASGTTTVNTETNAQTGTLTLRANAANALSVRVLDLTGNDEPVIEEHADEFEIRVLNATNATVATSTSTYPYALSLTPTQAGTAIYKVQVYSIEHGHPEETHQFVVTVVAQ